jgi:hypothetical protein
MLHDMGVQEEYIKPITMYCSQENLKDLNRLDKNLWDMGISNVHLRRRIINFWARSIGAAVPKELTQQFLTHDTGAPESVIRGAGGGALKWFVEDDGTGNPKLRPSRQGETGMTLVEAKAAIKEMRVQSGQGDEPVVEFNGETGQWVPNTKSAWVKANLQAAWGTARDYNRQMQEGNQPDPLDVMTEQLAKVEQVKASLGIKPPEQQGNKTDIVQMVEAMGKMDEIARNRQGGQGLPGWMTDPLAFMAAMKTINPPPTGPDPVVTAALEEVKAVRLQMQELKDEAAKREMDGLKDQNRAILQRLDLVQQELARPRGEPNAMSIMKDGVAGLRDEMAGARKDLKDIAQTAISGTGTSTDAAGRAERVAGMKTALQDSSRLELLTDQIDLALR